MTEKKYEWWEGPNARKNEKWEPIVEELTKYLGLERAPVAIKFIKSNEEFPAGVKHPKKPLTACQFVAAARFGASTGQPGQTWAIPMQGLTLAANENDLSCPFAKDRLGIEELPKEIFSLMGSAFAIVDGEDVAWTKLRKNVPQIPPGEIKGFVTAPLEYTPVEPDFVIVSVNPWQLTRCENAWSFVTDGEPLTKKDVGTFSTCAFLFAHVYNTDTPNAVVPCQARIIRGFIGSKEELFFALPKKYIDDFMKGLKRTDEAGWKYPPVLEFWPTEDIYPT
jgi:uncharacterized protein (DUF169 family)